MTFTFVDTSFLIALVLTDDALHTRAAELQRLIRGPLVCTEYVLLEFADALSAEPLRQLAVESIALLRNNAGVKVIPASTELLDAGLRLYGERLDKRWSLTDCTSFTVMREVGATDALTADHHFEQAGFKALLRPQ